MAWEGLKKIGRAVGAWEDDPAQPAQEQVPVQQQVPVQAAPMAATYVASFSATTSVNEEVYKAISDAISTGVVNEHARLNQMAETMRVAIPDEPTRIRAAAAACGLTADQILRTLDTLMANVQVEKNRFMTTDAVEMNNEVARINAQVEEKKQQIASLEAQISTAVTERTELESKAMQTAAEAQNITAIFEATAAKVLQDLDMEKKKVGIYIPQEIK